MKIQIKDVNYLLEAEKAISLGVLTEKTYHAGMLFSLGGTSITSSAYPGNWILSFNCYNGTISLVNVQCGVHYLDGVKVGSKEKITQKELRRAQGGNANNFKLVFDNDVNVTIGDVEYVLDVEAARKAGVLKEQVFYCAGDQFVYRGTRAVWLLFYSNVDGTAGLVNVKTGMVYGESVKVKSESRFGISREELSQMGSGFFELAG